ncbi:MAG: TRAP transporter substrate-binding protein [Gammaproteobacteria bacterium]
MSIRSKQEKMMAYIGLPKSIGAFLLSLLSILLLSGCSDGSDLSSDGAAGEAMQKYRWRLVTSWPPNLPVNHEGVAKFADDVKTMSSGQMTIQVFAAGELVPALQVFDAVSQGTVEMGHSAAYYWAGKLPAAQFMTAVPFGMNARGMWAWLYGEQGLDLWRELYAPFNLVPFPMGNTGTQMGGWFNKKINSANDLNGLKMRIPGLGGKTLANAGGNPILLSGGEVYTALERGNIDATEWVGPLHDVRFGLDRAAKYYYYPGWHEPSTQLELIVNKQKWESLPANLQAIIDAAATSAGVFIYSKMEVGNAQTYEKLKESGHVEVLAFPQDVLTALHANAKKALDAEAGDDQVFIKTRAAYESFRKQFDAWDDITEDPYRQFLNTVEDD